MAFWTEAALNICHLNDCKSCNAKSVGHTGCQSRVKISTIFYFTPQHYTRSQVANIFFRNFHEYNHAHRYSSISQKILFPCAGVGNWPGSLARWCPARVYKVALSRPKVSCHWILASFSKHLAGLLSRFLWTCHRKFLAGARARYSRTSTQYDA